MLKLSNYEKNDFLSVRVKKPPPAAQSSNSDFQTKQVNFKDKPSKDEKNKKRKNQTFFTIFFNFFCKMTDYL
jgi:hypothetical protein